MAERWGRRLGGRAVPGGGERSKAATEPSPRHCLVLSRAPAAAATPLGSGGRNSARLYTPKMAMEI